MPGRMAVASLIVAVAFFLAFAPLVTYADSYIPLNEHFTMNGKPVTVYLQGIDLASEEKSNIHYDVDPATVYWARLSYQYENSGDVTEQGFVTPVLIDSKGNQYRYKKDEPTTQKVPAHVRTGTFWLEIPVPKNATLTEIVFLDGTIDHSFKIGAPTVVPAPTGTPVPPGPPAPGGTAWWHECIPLIPFGLAGGIAATGMVINRSGIIKR